VEAWLAGRAAAVVRDFLRTTQTQLTVSGLFALNDSLQERDLVAVRSLSAPPPLFFRHMA